MESPVILIIDSDGKPIPMLRQMCFIAVIYKQVSGGNEWMWGDPESIAEIREKRANTFLFLSTEEDLFSEDYSIGEGEQGDKKEEEVD